VEIADLLTLDRRSSVSRPAAIRIIDGQPVDLVFLPLIPANAKEHPQALAAISRLLCNRHTASNLRTANGAQQAYDILTRTP